MATLQDIARQAGVSIATASHVVNNKKYVSPRLRERVLKAIRDLNYQPNAAARTLRTNKSNTVGIVVPDISDPFFPTLVRGAEDVVAYQGFTLLIGNSDNDFHKEEDYLRAFSERQVDGLIVVASADTAPEFLRRHDFGQIPLVFADRAYIDIAGDLVTPDNIGGSTLAVNHLIEMGYRRIATITGPSRIANARERLEGYTRALRSAGLMKAEAFICEGSFDASSGYELTRHLLQLESMPDAIFAANAAIAFGSFQALKENGISCPKEIGLISFDEQVWFDAVMPRISRMASQGYEIGSGAAELLLKRISGELNSEKVVRKLRCKLIARESTARDSGRDRTVPKSKAKKSGVHYVS